MNFATSLANLCDCKKSWQNISFHEKNYFLNTLNKYMIQIKKNLFTNTCSKMRVRHNKW